MVVTSQLLRWLLPAHAHRKGNGWHLPLGRREHVHTQSPPRRLQSSKGQDASQQSLRHGVPGDLAAELGGRQGAVRLSFPLSHFSLPDQVSLHLEGSEGSGSMKFLTISVSLLTWTESLQGCSTLGHLATPPRGSLSGLFGVVTLLANSFLMPVEFTFSPKIFGRYSL